MFSLCFFVRIPNGFPTHTHTPTHRKTEMEIIINLDEDDIRICKSIVSDQTHFTLNSSCIEDAVIAGILAQISKKNVAPPSQLHPQKYDEKGDIIL